MTELLFKAVGAAVLGVISAQTIRKVSPELGFALGTVIVTVILICSAGFLEAFSEVIELARSIGDGAYTYLLPVVKCAGVSAAAKIGSDICRDASNTSAASAVELSGTLCALGIAAPLVTGLLRMIKEII